MKYTLLTCLFALQLYALDENDIIQEIQNTKSIEELSTQMQHAPRQYRYHYIQAIKERTRIDNEAKRQQFMSEVSAEKNENIQIQQINSLTGKNTNTNNATRSSSDSCNGSGKGGNNAGGGHGGGKGRK